jgi:hypothetical protein
VRMQAGVGRGRALILKPRLKPDAKKPPKGAMKEANNARETCRHGCGEAAAQGGAHGLMAGWPVSAVGAVGAREQKRFSAARRKHLRGRLLTAKRPA